MNAQRVFLIALALLPTAAAARSAGKGEITGLAVTPDGKTLLVGDVEGKVRLIVMDKRKHRAEVQAHKGGLWDLALSADGKRFITGGEDQAVRIWDFARVKEIRTFEGHKDRLPRSPCRPTASSPLQGTTPAWFSSTRSSRARFATRCAMASIGSLRWRSPATASDSRPAPSRCNRCAACPG
jgi:WD40 repeat protein